MDRMTLRICARFVSRRANVSGLKNLDLPRHFVGRRGFQTARRCLAVKPFLLADIGEGIRECEIIQWFVEPEARVEEWDKLCEVQSDKASVEITSQFAGVIKKLHYEAGEMAKVGKPLLDIEVEGDAAGNEKELGNGETSLQQDQEMSESGLKQEIISASTSEPDNALPAKGKHATLATPAVRHLTKELNVNIADITGTGRDGRVSKEDVHQFARARGNAPAASTLQTSPPSSSSSSPTETLTPLTPNQAQMFKTMTASLRIPHFLYADEVDFSALTTLRSSLNSTLTGDETKLSYLPFIIKAVSIAISQYPILNARVDVSTNSDKPSLLYRSQHNIGIAMDTPSGLLVPVIHDVCSLSIRAIASRLASLQTLAAAGKLSRADLTGGTITVSNIGSIGGTYVAPVLVEREVAILGVGRVRLVPAFDGQGRVVEKRVCNLSWSADHRVVDGATMARAGEVVRRLVEEPARMAVELR